MSVSRDQILNLLEQTLEGHGLIGGRRKVRRSRSMPARRRSMRGRGEDMDVMGIEFDEMPSMNRYASVGNGLIGGRKKTKTKSKKMTAATKAYLAEYRRMNPRRKSGRGLIGGNVQDYFNDLVDEIIFNDPSKSLEAAMASARETIKEQKDDLKMGIRPLKTKDQLIRTIRSLEKRLGIPQSLTTGLKNMTKVRLAGLLKTLQDQQNFLRAPSRREMDLAEDEDRYESYSAAPRAQSLREEEARLLA